MDSNPLQSKGDHNILLTEHFHNLQGLHCEPYKTTGIFFTMLKPMGNICYTSKMPNF